MDIVFAYALCALTLISALSSAQKVEVDFRWTLISNGSGGPSPRSNPALVWAPAARRLLLWGGVTGAGRQSDLWSFDVATRTWSQLPSNGGPSGRTGFAFGLHTLGTTETLIIAHGTAGGHRVNAEVWGYNLTYARCMLPCLEMHKPMLPEVWGYNLTSLTWTQYPAQGPDARYGSAFGMVPGSQWLLMSHGFGRTHRYSDVWAYSVPNQAWTRLTKGNNEYTPTRPHARCNMATGMATPNRMVLYGGCMQNGFTGGPCPGRDVWVLEVQGNLSDPLATPSNPQWSKGDEGPSPREYTEMVRLPATMGLGTGLILLFGGSGEDEKQVITLDRASSTDIDIFDTNSMKWITTQAVGGVAPAYRALAGTAASEETASIYIFGGRVLDTNQDSNELWALTRVQTAQEPPFSSSGLAGGGLPNYVVPGWYIPPRTDTPTAVLYIHLHGLFMGLSWGVLLPMGVIIARYLRHKDPLWFKIHRACQVTGVLFSLVGLALVFVGGGANPAFAHGIIGLIVMLLGVLQPINAYYRPHKGERWRDQWEWLHKGSGYLAVLLGVVNVSLGVFLVLAPVGLTIAWFVILGVMLCSVAGLEARRWWYASRQAKLSRETKQESMHKEVSMMITATNNSAQI